MATTTNKCRKNLYYKHYCTSYDDDDENIPAQILLYRMYESLQSDAASLGFETLPRYKGARAKMLKKLQVAVFSLVLCAAFVSIVSATTIVVPNSLSNTEGDSNNLYPFNSAASMRYQQIFAATDFGALGVPMFITEIHFRPDINGHAFSSTIPNIQINLSTTSSTPDGLSSTFADNVGPDDTIVSSGSLALSSSDTGGLPRDFDIVINITPFLYDPAAGSLLLDRHYWK